MSKIDKSFSVLNITSIIKIQFYEKSKLANFEHALISQG